MLLLLPMRRRCRLGVPGRARHGLLCRTLAPRAASIRVQVHAALALLRPPPLQLVARHMLCLRCLLPLGCRPAAARPAARVGDPRALLGGWGCAAGTSRWSAAGACGRRWSTQLVVSEWVPAGPALLCLLCSMLRLLRRRRSAATAAACRCCPALPAGLPGNAEGLRRTTGCPAATTCCRRKQAHVVSGSPTSAWRGSRGVATRLLAGQQL